MNLIFGLVIGFVVGLTVGLVIAMRIANKVNARLAVLRERFGEFEDATSVRTLTPGETMEHETLRIVLEIFR